MRKQILKHPRYYVNENGEVFRLHKGSWNQLKPDMSNGYLRVDLDGTKEYVARLVLESFDPLIDPHPPMRVFYLDGNPANVKLNNLIWGTPSEIQLYSAYTVEYRLQKLGRGAR